MSRPPGSQIQELQDVFIDAPSFRNSVKAGGEIVRFDRMLFDAAPVLSSHLTGGDSFKELNVPASSLLALLEAHRSGTFPTDFPGLLNLLAAAAELELRQLTQQCFNEMKKFATVDYPSECSTEAVMLFFKMLVESPLRTTDIYKQQLTKLAIHCSYKRDVMTNAMKLVEDNIKQFNQLNLDPIPCDFDKRCLPIVIFKRAEKLHTAVLNGAVWEPVNLFGKHFNLEAYKVEDSFYLKYGWYLLYKSGSNVCRKNLRAKTYPGLILEGCTYFLTRGKFCFAVVKKGSDYCVMQWVDDDEFVSIYSTEAEIVFIDFGYDEHVLAIKLKSKDTFIFTLRETCLSLRNERYTGDYICALQLQRGQRLLFAREGQPSKLCVREFKKLESFPEGETVHSGLGKPLLSGGRTFILDDRGLSLVRKFPDNFNLTLTYGEYQALSELWMSM